MIRFFDFIFALLGMIILFPLMFLILIIGLLENGSPLYLQYRVGFNQKLFLLIKFRTMQKETKSVATHKINDSMITTYGYFLRWTKLDEIPQLLNVLLGHMSFVGPRPCLPNQKKLIIERSKRDLFKVKPGITGLAQISGVNMKTPVSLAKLDKKMVKQMNLYFYFNYIIRTIIFIFKKI